MLLIDHNVRRVVQISDCIYVLSLGEIAATGTSTLEKSYAHRA